MEEIKTIKIDDIICCIDRHVKVVSIEEKGSEKFNISLRIVRSLLDCLYVMTDYDFWRVIKETNIEKIIEYL